MRLRDEIKYWLIVNAGGPPSDKGPGSGNYERKKTAELSDSELEDKFRNELKSDWEGAKARYRAKFGNVLNTDNAKELSADYQTDHTRTAAVHKPSLELIQDLYSDMLHEPTPQSKENTVVLTAGPAGSGKTSGLSVSSELRDLKNRAHVVYDSTLTNMESSRKRVQEALDNGKDVHVIYVYRDPEESFRNGVLPRAEDPKDGRTVPIDMVAEQHATIRSTMKMLQREFGQNPHFAFTVIDNSHGLGGARETTFGQLPQANDSKEQLKVKLRQMLDDEFANGKISSKNYQASLR